MASTQRAQRVSPKGNYFTVPVDDLTGGIDLVKSATLLKPNRAQVLRNWSIRVPGSLVVWPGWRQFSTTSLGNARGQGGQRIYLGSSTPFMLYAYGGSVYKPTDAGVFGAAVASGWSGVNDIYFPYDQNIVAILDGATAAKKSLDGLTWTNFGIAAPAAPPTTAVVAGGSLVDGHTYEFSYTGQSNDGLLAESNASGTVQQACAAGNDTIQLTLAKHPDAQVGTLIYYGRDVTAGESTRRRIGTVANPGGASVTVNIAVDNWTSGVPEPTTNDVAPLVAFGCVWKNRWWFRDAVVKNRLRFSQVFLPQSVPATFFIDIPFERGDNITALVPLGDTLVVWGQTKPFLVLGQTSLDFTVRPSGAAQAGALGARAVDVLEEGQIHAAADGIYLFDGATDRLLTNDVDNFAPSAIGWRTYITSALPADLARTAVCYHKAAKQYAVAVQNLYPFGVAGEWVLDLNRTRLGDVPAWTSTDRAVGGYIKWDGNEQNTGNNGRLFSWDLTTGVLNEERTGTMANGANMVATYTGPGFSMGGRVARVVDGAVEVEPHGGTFGLQLMVDNVSLGSQNVDISGAFASYGSATYGVSTYGGSSRRRTPVTFPLEAEGLTCFVTGTYTGQEAFKWFTYHLGIVPETVERGL